MATPARKPAQPESEPQPKFLPIAKFARYLNTSRMSVYRGLKDGRLKYKDVGGRIHVEVPPTQEGPWKKKKPGPRKRAS
jgi:hypothetical protein